MAFDIQILGLRDRVDQKDGKTKKYEAFHNRLWRVDSEEKIFSSPNLVLAQIPSSEQYNLYWTVARCFPEKGRKLAEQHIIPWDIDHIGGDTQEEAERRGELVARAVCESLGVDYNQTGVIFSGNGVQLFIKIINPIMDEAYFDSVREHYKFLCEKIQIHLNNKTLQGEVDSSVFSAGRLMRFPNTRNVKPGRPERYARVLQSNLIGIVFDIVQKAGILELKKPDQIHPETIKKYPKPDTKAVLSGCLFIQNCFANQEQIKEPEWYAAMSIVSRLDDGHQLVHDMSHKHPSYSEHETELKITQALKNSGPRTCKDISTRWDGCRNCPHYGTDLTSPILIRGPDYIKTESTGYRDIKIAEDGTLKPGKVNYDDLIKRFGKDNPFITIADMRSVYQYNGKYWELFKNDKIREWANKLIKPSASAQEIEEFLNRLRMNNVRDTDWFTTSVDQKMNFKNGVLDLQTMELVPHSPDYGFTFVLDYAYDSRAVCPTWDKFMLDICSQDKKFVSLLEEFAGYAIAGGDCLAQKALVLYGRGANGKSVYAETIEQVLGIQNTGHLMVHHLRDNQMRAQLLHKPYNYSDETLDYAFKNPGEFKTLVTGGTTTAKIVYQATFNFKNKAKFIISTNKMPDTNDSSDGLHRRLIIAHFTAQFTGAQDNKMLRKTLWEQELAGICNRFIEGYKRLVQRGYNFDIPQSMIDMSEEFALDNNSVLRFAHEKIQKTQNEEDKILINEVYGEYVSWIQFENEKPVTLKVFSSLFRDALHLDKSTIVRKEGAIGRGWTKVKFNKQGEF